jgi:2-polyprenyl-6-methoxyphenol hydroxylase-like FAD-dependent oxidoreductase
MREGGGCSAGLHAAVRFVQRGVRVTVMEAAPHVAAHVQRWSHVRLFSPWKYNVCDSTVALLEAAGLYDNAQVRCIGPRGQFIFL